MLTILVSKNRQFNATRVVAEDALKAANVYKNIEDAVTEAEEAAHDAYVTVDETIDDVRSHFLFSAFTEPKQICFHKIREFYQL